MGTRLLLMFLLKCTHCKETTAFVLKYEGTLNIVRLKSAILNYVDAH